MGKFPKPGELAIVDKIAMASTSKGDLIQCHPLTSTPHSAWAQLESSQTFFNVKPHPLSIPVNNDAIRFVCISDTHSSKDLSKLYIPPGDVLLHAGDFTMVGSLKEIKNFNTFLGSLPHRYKVVIAGNHELSFDLPRLGKGHRKIFHKEETVDHRKYLTNCIYLEDSSVNIYGLSIYGAPWQPEFNRWAFNLPRGQPCLDKWKLIPENTDVLLTHTPPVGHGDIIYSGAHVGCVELLLSIQQRIKPKYHVFGHVHEGYGITSDGQTTFINCSSSNVRYELVNSPVIFDIPLPSGQKKGSL